MGEFCEHIGMKKILRRQVIYVCLQASLSLNLPKRPVTMLMMTYYEAPFIELLIYVTQKRKQLTFTERLQLFRYCERYTGNPVLINNKSFTISHESYFPPFYAHKCAHVLGMCTKRDAQRDSVLLQVNQQLSCESVIQIHN